MRHEKDKQKTRNTEEDQRSNDTEAKIKDCQQDKQQGNKERWNERSTKKQTRTTMQDTRQSMTGEANPSETQIYYDLTQRTERRKKRKAKA